ncbi:MAG: ribosome-associated translation inhibitor RaiA [Coriobacteriia bacterium]
MQIVVKARHMDLTPAIREYIDEKIGRVGKSLNHIVKSIEVELSVEKNPSIANGHLVEVTVHTKGPVIRAKEAAADTFAAIDLVTDKLERQVFKYKDRIAERHSPHGAVAAVAPRMAPEQAEDEPSIVKTKTVEVKPMSAEEAILQLELLGHDFFVFASADTDQVNVLYRRNDGDYGLILPQQA